MRNPSLPLRDSGGPGAAAAAPSARQRPPNRLGVYARLAKLTFFDYFLAVAVAAAALLSSGRITGATSAMLLLFLLGELAVFAAVAAFDDVTGYRDRSDQANYLSDLTGLRPIERKPLLTGELTERQAVGFGCLATASAGLLWVLAAAVAPYRPGWALVGAALMVLTSVQYSWGLKVSYRGGGEALIGLTALGFLVVPFGLAAGRLPGLVLIEGLLFGLWQVLVSCYSNTHDRRGDAAVGRRTVATTLSLRGNRAFTAALTGADVLLTVGAGALRIAPWWFAALIFPQLALRIRQLAGFLSDGNALLARRRGVRVHRVGVFLLVLVDLVHPVLPG